MFKGSIHWKHKGMFSYYDVIVTPSKKLTDIYSTIHLLLCNDPTMVDNHVPCRTQRKDSFCKPPERF